MVNLQPELPARYPHYNELIALETAYRNDHTTIDARGRLKHHRHNRFKRNRPRRIRDVRQHKGLRLLFALGDVAHWTPHAQHLGAPTQLRLSAPACYVEQGIKAWRPFVEQHLPEGVPRHARLHISESWVTHLHALIPAECAGTVPGHTVVIDHTHANAAAYLADVPVYDSPAHRGFIYAPSRVS